jgi:CDP-diacylglycerol--glycerol-3-phosphate 3-phosphatidyltransferase
MLRIVLVPVFVVMFLLGWYLPALIVFAVASITDTLDGYLARSRNLVTNFGKLMDPLADKILVMAAMLCFVEAGICPAWVVIIILAREFLVTSLRLVAASDGIVIAADIWGKMKTIAQMLWIVAALLALTLSRFSAAAALSLLARVLMWVSVILATLSGANYCWKNRAVFLKDL